MTLALKTVLVVEDDRAHNMMLCKTLENMGVGHVISAYDGIEAIRVARYYMPDLVVLDLGLPKMDGFDVCRKIRLFAAKIAMPIMVITASDQQDVLDKIFSLGANDYFMKPFDATELENRISFYLNYCRAFQDLMEAQKSMDQDLALAHTIQKNLLPPLAKTRKALKSSRLDFYAVAKTDRLGGDAWHFMTMADGAPVLWMHDITGHGLNAALNNSLITSLVHQAFDDARTKTAAAFSPSKFLAEMNNVMGDYLDPGMFCTALCMVWDGKGVWRYAGCGLPDIIVTNPKKKTFQRLPASGIPLGLSDDKFAPSFGRIRMKKGDIMLAMTDGMIEAQPRMPYRQNKTDNVMLPAERLLRETLEGLEPNTPCQEVITSLFKRFEAEDFDMTQDDITVIAAGY